MAGCQPFDDMNRLSGNYGEPDYLIQDFIVRVGVPIQDFTCPFKTLLSLNIPIDKKNKVSFVNQFRPLQPIPS